MKMLRHTQLALFGVAIGILVGVISQGSLYAGGGANECEETLRQCISTPMGTCEWSVWDKRCDRDRPKCKCDTKWFPFQGFGCVCTE